MRACTLVGLLLFSWFFRVDGQYVQIPDNNFLRELIDEGVDLDNDRRISYAEAEAVTSLHLLGEIEDLTGIEAFIHLEELDCKGIGWAVANHITFLDVSSLQELKVLDCSYNDIHTLILGPNLSLAVLRTDFNLLTDIDVSGCPNLVEVDVGGNYLPFLDLRQNHHIEKLLVYEMFCPVYVCLSQEDFPLDHMEINTEGEEPVTIGNCEAPVLTLRTDSIMYPGDVEYLCSEDAIVYLVDADTLSGADMIIEYSLGAMTTTALSWQFFGLEGIERSGLWLVAIDEEGYVSEFVPFTLYGLPDEDEAEEDDEGSDEGVVEEDDGQGGEDAEEEQQEEEEREEEPLGQEDFDVLVFPNPTRNIVTIRTAGDADFSFDLLNDKGQLLVRRNEAASPFQLQLRELKYGIYMFRIIVNNELYLKKVVRL